MEGVRELKGGGSKGWRDGVEGGDRCREGGGGISEEEKVEL